MRYTWGYAPPLIIEAAIRNGFFDALKDGSRTAAQVSQTTGASLRGVTSVMYWKRLKCCSSRKDIAPKWRHPLRV